jgi:tRNA-dihydrouridine synthase B
MSQTLGLLPTHNLINFNLCLAPMVGLSHLALRELCLDYMPQNAHTIWPTEMLNSRKLPYEDFALTPETMKHSADKNLVPQILGNEEKFIADSIEKLVAWGAIGVDINMGCPVKKALRHNYGVALMGDAKYAAEVVRVTVKNSSVPVSVKLRAVHESESLALLDFIKGLEDAGASWITLHPRTPEQKRRGQADWDQIRDIGQKIKIPIIGNGDIQTADDVLKMKEQTSCAMVMSGRALTARPWLFWQVGERLGFEPPVGQDGRKAPATPIEEGAEYGRALMKMSRLCCAYFGEELGLRKFRFFVRTGSPWLMFGHQLYALTTKAKNFSEMKIYLEEFFSRDQEMCGHTELRQ